MKLTRLIPGANYQYHLPQRVLSELACFPRSHVVQVEAPISELTVPSSHGKHSVLSADWYVPAEQGTEVKRLVKIPQNVKNSSKVFYIILELLPRKNQTRDFVTQISTKTLLKVHYFDHVF